MLDSLITSKTRIKLLLKFFLNPATLAHLRGLEAEFGESSNAIRLELNKLEEANMLKSKPDGNKKVYAVNTEHPLFADIHSIVKKYLGLDHIIHHILNKLGGLQAVYLRGKLATGLDAQVIELILIGTYDTEYLQNLIAKAEPLLNRRIEYVSFSSIEDAELTLTTHHCFLLWA